eukprot:TRINITY_DN1858_c0_g1_i1.p1 TRINITY_DN1858_c0_g1~~TRINITY_DN1858_c0_g1_i1.p1  ORF type:complete len:175 (+),score=47.41 TRINITY_DN1858_c0_g1_i1:35-526(+)
MKLITLFFVLGLALTVYSACVAPPTDLNLCKLSSNARVPQAYANTNADRELESYFEFLQSINALPTESCAEAFVEFSCSNAYPRCEGDANSGLDIVVNTCYYQCHDFVEECRGQLIGIERPDCGQFSVDSQCTARNQKFSSDSTSLSAGIFYIIAAMIAIYIM